MFDDQGIWHDEISHEPSSGFIPGLDVGNEVQSYQNFQRAREAETLGTMLKLRALGQAGADVGGTPEGGQAERALGISPESIEQMWQNSPEMQFRNWYKTAAPEDLTAENILGKGIGFGMGERPGFTSEAKAMESIQATKSKAHTQELHEGADTLRRNYATLMVQGGDPQDTAQQAWLMSIASHPEWAQNEELQRNAHNWMESLPETVGGIQGAQTEKALAQASRERLQGKKLEELLPAQLDLMRATATARRAMADSAEARAMHMDGSQPLSAKDLAANGRAMAGFAEKYEAEANKAERLDDPIGAEKNRQLASKMREESAAWMQMSKNAGEQRGGAGAGGKALPTFKTPDEVKAAIGKTITYNEAVKILMTQFNMRP